MARVNIQWVEGMRSSPMGAFEQEAMEYLNRIALRSSGVVRSFFPERDYASSMLQHLRSHQSSLKVSVNPVDYLIACQLGNRTSHRASFDPEYGTRHMICNDLLQERVYDIKQHNKVFTCQWLNDSTVVMGTKCNNLIVLDVNKGKTTNITTLPSSNRFTKEFQPCGVHAIELNPSKTLMATGGTATNELAVYKLPSLDPYTVGEGSHDDWIFDIEWLDDELLLTGSRDSTIAVWKVDEQTVEEGAYTHARETNRFIHRSRDCNTDHESLMSIAADMTDQVEDEDLDERERSHSSNYQSRRGHKRQRIREEYGVRSYIKSVDRINCKKDAHCNDNLDGKIRSLLFNRKAIEIVALVASPATSLHVYDAMNLTLRARSSFAIPQDNVCLVHDQGRSLYAIGSKSSMILVDESSLEMNCKIPIEGTYHGIRSITMLKDTATIGTGNGAILFVDLRTMKFMEVKDDYESNSAVLKASEGYVIHDEHYMEAFANNMFYSPAIYTHKYNPSLTRLFAAGGPLPAAMSGNYVSLWS